MRTLLQMLFIQELFYGGFLVVLGFVIGLQHGWESGVKTFLYALLFIQPAIFLINKKIIKAALFPEIKDKKPADFSRQRDKPYKPSN